MTPVRLSASCNLVVIGIVRRVRPSGVGVQSSSLITQSSYWAGARRNVERIIKAGSYVIEIAWHLRKHRHTDEFCAGISFVRQEETMMPVEMTPGSRDVPSAAPTFDEMLGRHRRALHLFCYRMVASYTDAEDLTQEAMMRAWKARDTYDVTTAEIGFRRWLYRIASNACLDFLKSSARKMAANAESFAEVPWLQPYPEHLLDEDVAGKETVALGYLALIQMLPAQQRAVFVLRDVLGWSAQEAAVALDISVAAANSALQRARETVARSASNYPTSTATSDEERAVLAAYIATHQGTNVAACIAVMAQDIRVTMPPHPVCYVGRDALSPLVKQALKDFGTWRLVPTRANGQPAAVCYLRRPGDTVFRLFKLDVLRVVDGAVAEITTFDPRMIGGFELAEVLS
jgi:RNA polymerase sigma-70 factor (TIGR02960 family)